MATLVSEGTHEVGDAGKIMDRPEFVDMGQDGLDAVRFRLKTGIAQQRIEPDQAAARAMQAVDLEAEAVVWIALKTIGDQQHDCSLAQHATCPKPVERVKRGRDAGAARPVRDAG